MGRAGASADPADLGTIPGSIGRAYFFLSRDASFALAVFAADDFG